jgi:hypothetical protein
MSFQVEERPMRKIALFTMYGNSNFGNRLQAYASQQVLFSFGFQVDNIITRSIEEIKTPVQKILNKLCKTIKLFVHPLKLIQKFVSSLRRQADGGYFHRVKKRRAAGFVKFSNEFIREKDYGLANLRSVPEFPESEYDYFVAGSDQIWNPHFGYCKQAENDFSPWFLLPFGKTEQKFALSSSFGISLESVMQFPKFVTDDFAYWIGRLKRVSCREREGANIVKHLCGKNAEVLVDPTMMLTREEWLKIARKPKFVKDGEKFIVSYFLGCKYMVSADGKREIKLNDREQPEVYADTSPSEFVWLIAHADEVHTDSFHGAVFSLIMHTPFEVHKRIGDDIGMGSRMDTLFQKFGITNKCSDFNRVDDILAAEREKARAYIADCLKGPGGLDG